MTELIPKSCDVIIVGAGPAGALAAKLLHDQNIHVVVFEKAKFPRFVIGESLLPQSMMFLEKAGMLPSVQAHGFQFKDGANFSFGDKETSINFKNKTAAGWSNTFQVQREEFDNLLANAAMNSGVPVFFEHDVKSVDVDGERNILHITNPNGDDIDISCRFIMDASGYGRVLSRMLGLERPSTFPVRHAFFTHVKDKLSEKEFDRNKIQITVHPKIKEIWSWLIPFSNSTSSVGVIIPPDLLHCENQTPSETLWSIIGEMDLLSTLLEDAEEIRPVAQLKGYSANVSKLATKNFALLGNAAEFLDPVFSSGVTIAMKSADLAVANLVRQLRGESVDWEREFSIPLMTGVNCFRAFVEAWYDGRLQKIIKYPPAEENEIQKMIISILAGYAWDEKNPFVQKPEHLLDLVADQCA